MENQVEKNEAVIREWWGEFSTYKLPTFVPGTELNSEGLWCKVGGGGCRKDNIPGLGGLQSSRGQAGNQGSSLLLCCNENKDSLWESGRVPPPRS